MSEERQYTFSTQQKTTFSFHFEVKLLPIVVIKMTTIDYKETYYQDTEGQWYWSLAWTTPDAKDDQKDSKGPFASKDAAKADLEKETAKRGRKV